jgi:hypothetical protein
MFLIAVENALSDFGNFLGTVAKKLGNILGTNGGKTEKLRNGQVPKIPPINQKGALITSEYPLKRSRGCW